MQSAKVGDAWLHVEAALRAGDRNLFYINVLGSDLRIWDGAVVRLAASGFGAYAKTCAATASPILARRRR